MKLLDLIKENQALTFNDLKQNRVFQFDEMLYKVPDLPEYKFLIFHYSNNSIESLMAFFSYWSYENTVITLLSDSISLELKKNLEELYNPLYISDQTREIIPDYGDVSKNLPFKLFKSLTAKECSIAAEIKLLLSTSGTTGSPKLVKLSEQNVVENALSIIDYLPIKPTDRTPLNLPIHYSYGLSVLTSNAIAGGIIYTSVDDILKQSFWETFQKLEFTSIAGVPFVYEMLARIGFLNKELACLRYFTQAGGRLNEDLIEKFYYFSVKNESKFYVMYGQTEATARMSYLPPDQIVEKSGSIGRPIKNGTFIIDPETNELCYKGPNVFGGYCETHFDLNTYVQPEWLKTGDLGRIDKDGFIYITGRLKRFAKIAGYRVNLDELENLLKGHFHLTNLACINFLDKKILLFITNDRANDTELLLEYIRDQFGIHHTLIKVEIIDEIPYTLNGKVNYQQLQSNAVEPNVNRIG
ncbi:AMP-binding protein [Solitalea sp. MAHUQ-68]|uniref:AMP-binding protein n=1 Tax=Solitalea agri TaxID=2953739 RepID=A0A9X2JCN2_9SPHI|nr:AMP-binding protein [Solitalea agri]MCO4293662.1 AMP-binding protein [Solitalea agri]